MVGVGGADEARGVPQLGDVHGPAVDAVALQPASGSRRSRAPTAPTSSGRRPRWPMPKAMLAATPPRRTSRSSTRNDSEILSSCSTTQRVGEAAREGHQVVGRDGTGDGDLHAATRTRRTSGPPTDAERPAVRGGRGPPGGRSRRAGGSAEGVAAGAGAAGVGVVDGEALLLDGVGEVDRGALRGTGALIRSTTTSTPSKSRDEVAVERALVEEELVDAGRSSRRAARRRAGAGRRDPPARAGS